MADDGSANHKEGTTCTRPERTVRTDDPIADLAGDVLTELYRAVCGHMPRAVRAYHDDDALLILLRFDPAEMTRHAADGIEQLLEGAFIAMPGMIASALEARSGMRLAPGNLSVCAERGLAVFAFSASERDARGRGRAELRGSLAHAATGVRPTLRIAG